MARAALLLVLLALLAPAPALGQGGSNPFGPLPPPAPTPAPEPELPADAGGDDGDVSRSTLFLIGAGVLAAFFGIGWAITRDARRNLTREDRALVEGARHPDQVRAQRTKQKQRARARAKAQRQARRKGRR